ncbi:hypothetical protein [Geomobilimonas luticola]|uniref:Uncharacterized protein n=1 Tax=Geomobilimonas luticola TaxID=1114878 RepID=A0ABS5SC16_9BACT|nr:hypothetical protein [Geomobilimonas luticola]MBT0652908.1 hypothetical protein [Geomobilimonas luticola]
MECNEQRLFGIEPLGRSIYHPEKLLEVWEHVQSDQNYCNYLKENGFEFDFVDKAMELTRGWIYVGDTFIEDFMEIEQNIGVEMMFPDPETKEPKAVFKSYKHQSVSSK